MQCVDAIYMLRMAINRYQGPLGPGRWSVSEHMEKSILKYSAAIGLTYTVESADGKIPAREDPWQKWGGDAILLYLGIGRIHNITEYYITKNGHSYYADSAIIATDENISPNLLYAIAVETAEIEWANLHYNPPHGVR